MVTIGIVCLLASTTFCGFYMAHLFEKRYAELRAFQHGLKLFETELTYGHTPLYEAFQIISKQVEAPIGKVFYAFSQKLQEKDVQVEKAWKEVLREKSDHLALSKKDYTLLSRFAEGLGKHDLYTEQKHLENFSIHLQMQCDMAKEKIENESKMVRSLGVLIGLLLVIIFV